MVIPRAVLWSAAAGRRFARSGDPSPKPRRAARGSTLTAPPAGMARLATFDGDKSPAQSDAKASQSKIASAPAENIRGPKKASLRTPL